MAIAPVPQQLTTRNTAVIPGTLRKPYPPFNENDLCLSQDHVMWDELVAAGGLSRNCCPKGRPRYNTKPWIAMPKEGRRFRPISSIPVSSIIPFTGTDQLVLSVRVPTGYDGVITDVVCGLTANGSTGFVEGSGDVTWRLGSDGRWLRDMGNVQLSLGSLTAPSQVQRGGLVVRSHSLVNFYVSMVVGAEARINPDARVLCSITGWWWPR